MTASDFLPPESLSYLEVFARRASITPHAPAFFEVRVEGSSLASTPHSYLEIITLARRAAWLMESRRLEPGDRVLLAAADPALFLAFFLGAQAIGVVVVPVPSRGEFPRAAAYEERLGSVARSSTPTLLVEDEVGSWEGIPRLDASAVRSPTEDPHRWHTDRRLGETAFLQYTSGSTGAPKGVIVTHGNLAANLRAIALGARMTERDASVSWLPHYHDMGLVGGWLLGTWMRTSTFVLSPRAFVSRPDAWLRAVAEYRATYTVAPNFAYHLLAKRLPDFAVEGLDLSSLRLAFDGAEPIDASTARAFVERFHKNGMSKGAFYPVYGMAECTLAAAFPTPGEEVTLDHVDRDAMIEHRLAKPAKPRATDVVTFVSVGRALPDHRIRILDAGGQALPERHLGEIAVSGPSVSPGYFGHPRRSSAELLSGDLGYLADGMLYVVDRLKDLVIACGRNYVPSDLERVACSVSGVKPGNVAVFGTQSDGTEGVVVVIATDKPTLAGVLRSGVRDALQSRVGLSPRDVCIVEKGEIPKTSSGKIQRGACKRAYEEGSLRRVATLAHRGRSATATIRSGGG
jgi:acyl-CoA synthetase (AMP-forming)/AMP-acid ligase II